MPQGVASGVIGFFKTCCLVLFFRAYQSGQDQEVWSRAEYHHDQPIDGIG